MSADLSFQPPISIAPSIGFQPPIGLQPSITVQAAQRMSSASTSFQSARTLSTPTRTAEDDRRWGQFVAGAAPANLRFGDTRAAASSRFAGSSAMSLPPALRRLNDSLGQLRANLSAARKF